MATIRAWAAVVTFACHTTTTPAESTLIFKHPDMNTTNTKEHYILLYSPNILSLIAIPSIDTCHSPSAPWHISSRTRPVLRKARCNSQGHGKSLHTRGPTPDSQTTFLLATLAPLQKRPLGICHCMRRCSQSRHKATYKDTSALKIIRQSSYISKEPHTTAVSKRLFIRRIHASHFDGFHVARSYGRFPQQHCGLEHIFFLRRLQHTKQEQDTLRRALPATVLDISLQNSFGIGQSDMGRSTRNFLQALPSETGKELRSYIWSRIGYSPGQPCPLRRCFCSAPSPKGIGSSPGNMSCEVWEQATLEAGRSGPRDLRPLLCAALPQCLVLLHYVLGLQRR